MRVANTILIVGSTVVDENYATQKQNSLEARFDKMLNQLSAVVEIINDANRLIADDTKRAQDRVDKKLIRAYS